MPIIRERIFGQDYAKTLATWRNNFRAAWPHLRPLGFDDRFRRLWKYYLAYCEAGFLSGTSMCARWCRQTALTSNLGRLVPPTCAHYCANKSRKRRQTWS